jgi:hypothetical protein
MADIYYGEIEAIESSLGEAEMERALTISKHELEAREEENASTEKVKARFSVYLKHWKLFIPQIDDDGDCFLSSILYAELGKKKTSQIQINERRILSALRVGSSFPVPSDPLEKKARKLYLSNSKNPGTVLEPPQIQKAVERTVQVIIVSINMALGPQRGQFYKVVVGSGSRKIVVIHYEKDAGCSHYEPILCTEQWVQTVALVYV